MTMVAVASALARDLAVRGIRVGPPSSQQAVEAFERRYRVRMTTELREYFSTIGGMPDDAMDSKTQLRIWRLDEVVPATEHLGPADVFDGYFILADYLLWSHAFAVRLENVERPSSEVAVIGGSEPVRVAASWLEFLKSQL